MWHNVVILLIYLAIFHFVVRTYDFYVDLLGLDKPFVHPPLALNAKQLRALLNHRGILYTGIVEKEELTKLVDLSGRVTEADLDDALNHNNEEVASENSTHLSNFWLPERVKKVVQEFSGSDHFYEQVEDSKDSAWIVHVIAEKGYPVVNDIIWHQLIHKLTRFGIRFGILYCKYDTRMCEQRRWNTSRLLMALPRADRVKSNVVLHTYDDDGAYRTQPLLQWVYGLMKQNVRRLNTANELSLWLSQSCATDVCLLFISTLTLPPFFLSALSVKFTGRVKFGACNQRVLRSAGGGQQHQQQQLSLTDNDGEPPSANHPAGNNGGEYPPSSPDTGQYVVVTDGHTVGYGAVRRERLSYEALKTYLKCLAPDINDVFLTSLAMANVLAVMSVFDIRNGGPVQYMLHLFGTLLKYNFVLLLFWVGALSVVNWKTTLQVCKFFTIFLRRLVVTYFLRYCIALWISMRNYTFTLGSSFVLFNTMVFYLRRKFFPSTLRQSESWYEWLRSANIGNVPIVPDARRFYNFFETSTDNGGVEGRAVESINPALLCLVQKYNIVHVRLRPSVCYDYILDLPCWIYAGSGMPYSDDSEMGFTNITGNTVNRPNATLCFRCRCVKSLNLRHLSKKLSRRPCRKCGFRGDGNFATKNTPFLLASRSSHVTYQTEEEADPAVSSCPICLDRFNAGDVVCCLPCQHAYHQRCILSWLLRDQPSCPCCRWPANETKEKVS